MNQDYLRVFETESDYDLAKPDFIYPTVSYVRDMDDVRYMDKPIPNYLYIEALADNCEVNFSSRSNEVLCSTDGNEWSTLSKDTEGVVINQGEKLYIKGECEVYNDTYFGPQSGYFNISQQCNVGGNIMSLSFLDNFENIDLTNVDFGFGGLFNELPIVNASELILPATTLTSYCYSNMFRGCTLLTTAPVLPATTLSDYCYNAMFFGCTSLTAAPALPATALTDSCYQGMFEACTSLTTAPVLPATTLAEHCYNSMFSECTSLTAAPALPATVLTDYCYYRMFNVCTSLEVAPALPATTLTDSCYGMMFSGCTSLVTAPRILPATTLAYQCYGEMFDGCTSLTTAPELPATTLVENCYNNMFISCSNLNYIKMLATDISAVNCLNLWVDGVSSTGTFVKNPAISEETIGRSWNGIPVGWTVVDAE